MPSFDDFEITYSSNVGTQTLTITAPANTGREPREVLIKADSTNLSPNLSSSNNLSISQSAFQQFIDIPNPSSAIPASGGSVTTVGTANVGTLKYTGISGVTLESAEINLTDSDSNWIDIKSDFTGAGYSNGTMGKASQYRIRLGFSMLAGAASGTYTITVATIDGTTASDTVTISKSSQPVNNELWFATSPSGSHSTNVEIELDSDGTANTSVTLYGTPEGVIQWDLSKVNS